MIRVNDLYALVGTELLSHVETKKPIIEGFLWEEDGVILGGPGKVGKSLFIMQLLCSLATGEEFIQGLKPIGKVAVCYVQTEGALGTMRGRMERMINGLEFSLDTPLYSHVPFRGKHLDSQSDFLNLLELLNGLPVRPKVIVVDTLFRAVSGQLSDSKDCNRCLDHIDILRETFKAAVILVHHTPKSQYTLFTGDAIDKGDNVFGSVFWTNWVDHQFYFTKVKDNVFKLRCETQREGNVIPELSFRLHQPDPLYFERIQEKTHVKGEAKE